MISMISNDVRERTLERREIRKRGRLWGRGFGFLKRIRQEEAAKLDPIYRNGFNESVVRGNPDS
jgi:hypothetical protein